MINEISKHVKKKIEKAVLMMDLLRLGGQGGS
jgi:hypothetical protein